LNNLAGKPEYAALEITLGERLHRLESTPPLPPA